MNKKSDAYKKQKKVANDAKSFKQKLKRKDFKKQLNKDKIVLKKLRKIARDTMLAQIQQNANRETTGVVGYNLLAKQKDLWIQKA